MRYRIPSTAIVSALLLAGCGGHNLTPMGAHQSGGGVQPHVVQNGTQPINWTQFNDPASGFSNAYSVVVGSDKNIWFGNGQSGLMQVAMTGKTKLFPMSYVCSGPNSCPFYPGYGITVGKDKNFYMGGSNYDYNASKYVVGVATTAGKLTAHDIPSGDYVASAGFTLGPDGNVWYLEQQHVAKITTGGTITEYAYPSGATANSYGGITTGPDGNIWFSEYNKAIIAKLVPATHAITEYPLTGLPVGCAPAGIVSGPDGNIYFDCTNGWLGQISTAGVAHLFYMAYGTSYFPGALIKGPDGNVWFPTANGAYISEFNPTNLSVTTYIPPYSGGVVYQMALGPDDNLWGASSDNKVDVYVYLTLVVTPSSLTFGSTGQQQNLTVAEPNTNSWTASSTSPGVCSVAQGNKNNIFVVTSVGIGTTKITVKDAIGNSFVVGCKVT